MKKLISGMAAVLLILSLAACNNEPKKPDMYIEKAQLTQQEENIAELLGASSAGPIYDFKLDDTVKTIQINTYELADGAWKLVSGGGGLAFSDENGRLALDFENIAEELKIALQSKSGSHSTTYSAEPADKSENGRATSILNQRTAITYEQEIPLVIQISSAENSISSYDADYFFKPEEYEKQGYEHVYAITILFSKKTLNELDRTE